jgi:hypothetical protein
MTAQGVEKIPWAETTVKGGREEIPQPRPRLFSAAKIRELFGKIAAAVTGKPTPSLKARRKKRGEDTRGLFRKLAMKVFNRLVRTIPEPDPWFMPPGELDDTQRLLMRQRQAQEGFWQQQHNQAFHYDPRNHLSPRF